MAESTLTPMMQQYTRMKREVPADAILLFRLGDFYEMFFDDAKAGAQILNIALTQRQGVPMCGIPFHAAHNYIAKLVKAGKRVAIADQTEEATPGKLVNRDLTQIISPGSVVDANLLEPGKNNFLGGLCGDKTRVGFAVVDLTTGEFKLAEFDSDNAWIDEIHRVGVSELIIPPEWMERLTRHHFSFPVTVHDGWTFEFDFAAEILKKHFQTQSLDGFGLAEARPGVSAAGAVLHYLQSTLRRQTQHITSLRSFQSGSSLVLDLITRRNLELVEPLNAQAAKNTTLLAALDRTVTPMGARALRDWTLRPLVNRTAIQARQSVVTAFLKNPVALAVVRQLLGKIRDVERIISRLSQGYGNARDLNALRDSVREFPALKAELGTFECAGVNELAARIGVFPDIDELVSRAILDEPSASLKEGGMIREGYSAELDELLIASRDGKDWIAALQAREQERTGIKSLKVRFNSVFGYYIEVSKANLSGVPEDYIRKQTLVNAERFITPELKDMEGKILGGEERRQKLEYDLFLDVREKVVAHTSALQATAQGLAEIDCLGSFAETAQLYDYVCPEINATGKIQIEEGRHPVIEQINLEEKFIPNDTRLNDTDHRVLMITGPNMAGKSTYIRQVALLVLMTHMGSFIPAKSAQIALVDRIFTRVGAHDDLSRGQSTFMVEMNETANILNNATDRSLVILDEIGRGTSTFDGLSIAWATAEYLHTHSKTKTLFATHYHELTELALSLEGVKNFHVAVREWNDQIIFLRKINPGGTDKSYGIQVARLAGLPKTVVDRAKQILARLEEDELDESGVPRLVAQRARQKKKAKQSVSQLDMFSQQKS